MVGTFHSKQTLCLEAEHNVLSSVPLVPADLTGKAIAPSEHRHHGGQGAGALLGQPPKESDPDHSGLTLSLTLDLRGQPEWPGSAASVLPTTQRGRSHYPHFAGRETKAQGGQGSRQNFPEWGLASIQHPRRALRCPCQCPGGLSTCVWRGTRPSRLAEPLLGRGPEWRPRL